ncbi:MAG: carotenoid oxygenase family protein [Cyanobacteria bacterium P01_H01_bin.121]
MTSSTAPARSSATPNYTLEDWRGGYRSQPQEFDYAITAIEGTIPVELRGTLFRNGPGLLDVEGQRLHHPFDGDGLICKFTFDQGHAHFQSRYVRSEGYVAEQTAGKILYRGVFGTQKPGGWLANAFDLRLKNIANTNILYWGDKLLALWEAAKPHRLDPQTLQTLGLDDLDGLLGEKGAFSAHPRIDPGSEHTQGERRLVNFALEAGLSSKLHIYEFDAAGKLLQQQVRTIPGFAFIHDFALTPNYCIFFQNPVRFNPLPFLAGFKGAAQCIDFLTDQPTQAIIVPRDFSKPVQTVQANPCFVFHHANAFEVDEQRIVIDSVCYDNLPSVEPDADFLEIDFTSLAPGQLWRYELDLATQTSQRQLLVDRCCEFPSQNPATVGQTCRYYYLGAAAQPNGNAPLQLILKYDITTGESLVWSAAPRGFISEPLFVPHPQATREDHGWVLTLIYNAERQASDLVILDALNLEEIARLQLRQHIPYGLHGSFVSEVFA